MYSYRKWGRGMKQFICSFAQNVELNLSEVETSNAIIFVVCGL